MGRTWTVQELAATFRVTRQTIHTLLRVVHAPKKYQQINGRLRRVVPESFVSKMAAARDRREATANT